MLMAVCMAGGLSAQGYIFINSETVFKSQADYNAALAQIDTLSSVYQKNIDKAYADLDEDYNNYVAQKSYLSETERQTRENTIVTREKEIKKYQDDVFGPDGDLMKKRVELIKPIQERVFAVINKYANEHKLDMVIDRANNQTLLFYRPELDKTDTIINLLK